MTTTLFIGAGKVGQALGRLVKKNNYEAIFWDSDLTKVPNQRPLEEGVEKADLIFLCVPSWAVRKASTDIKPHLKKETPVISLAKGLEEESSKIISEVLAEALPPGQPSGLLIGPMLATEIDQDVPTAGLIASKDKKVFKLAKAVFKKTCLHLFYSSDVRGAAFCSVLKNIYAVGFGIAEAIDFKHNGRGWYAALALTEMRKIIKLLGGKGETAHGLAGIGDLVATGFSPHSRNRTVGEQLIKTGVCDKSEGCVALPLIWKQLGDKTKKFPLLELLHRVIVEGKSAREEFGKFFGV